MVGGVLIGVELDELELDELDELDELEDEDELELELELEVEEDVVVGLHPPYSQGVLVDELLDEVVDEVWGTQTDPTQTTGMQP